MDREARFHRPGRRQQSKGDNSEIVCSTARPGFLSPGQEDMGTDYRDIFFRFCLKRTADHLHKIKCIKFKGTWGVR